MRMRMTQFNHTRVFVYHFRARSAINRVADRQIPLTKIRPFAEQVWYAELLEVLNFFCPFPVAKHKSTQGIGILNIFREVIKTKEVINRETNQNRN